MTKQKKKIFKIRLTKSTELSLSIKPNFVLPRALRPLCRRSLLKKVLKTPENIILAFLNLIALGFELEHAARRYPGLLITKGLHGVARYELEKERYIQHRILMQLKRQKLIEQRNLGNKLVFNLTLKGEAELLKKKIYFINQTAKDCDKKCVIIFDIPETERIARHSFRRFLKNCGFKRVQKSVWCAKAEVLPHFQEFIKNLGIGQWVKIIMAENII